jgi:hypothetical protein
LMFAISNEALQTLDHMSGEAGRKLPRIGITCILRVGGEFTRLLESRDMLAAASGCAQVRRSMHAVQSLTGHAPQC